MITDESLLAESEWIDFPDYGIGIKLLGSVTLEQEMDYLDYLDSLFKQVEEKHA